VQVHASSPGTAASASGDAAVSTGTGILADGEYCGADRGGTNSTREAWTARGSESVAGAIARWVTRPRL
jgi:hypothetical protein